MIVGLPGAGISAFFYLLLILLMPVRLGWQLVRRSQLQRGHGRLLLRQTAIAVGILASFAVIGLTLEAILPAQPAQITQSSGAAAVQGGIQKLGAIVAILTLLGLLAVIQLLSMTALLRQARVRTRHAPVTLRRKP